MAVSERFARTPFAAGVVGSLPRPLMVREMLPELPGPASAAAARSPQMDAAVRYAIAVQEQAGLDLVSDGEWRRHAYTHVIADIATGFTGDARTEPHRWGISVTEPMEVVNPGLIAEEARFLVEATDRMTKVCVPSPYLLGVRLWEREVSSRAYPTRDRFIEEVAVILRQELLALQETGVTVVQVDEPHLCVLVDPSYRDSFEDARYEMDLAADDDQRHARRASTRCRPPCTCAGATTGAAGGAPRAATTRSSRRCARSTSTSTSWSSAFP